MGDSRTLAAMSTIAVRRTGVDDAPARRLDWVNPTLVMGTLVAFGIYATWVVLLNTTGRFGPYLSPFYSPPITVRIGGLLVPPALWVAWAPLALRASCYHYRKAYFRGLFWHPLSCAAPERQGRPNRYRGENGFWAINNLHRFTLYAILVQLAFLWYDVAAQFVYQGRFHFGVGSVIMIVNVVCLSAYTFGCHALRHLAGGGADCLSCHRTRLALWRGVTVLNVRHGVWAWTSLMTVALTDVYIRLLLFGVVPNAWWV